MTDVWTEATIQAVLKKPQALLTTEPWKTWIARQGGLPVLYATFAALPLPAQERQVLTLLLDQPGLTHQQYAVILSMHRVTFQRTLRRLVGTLTAHLTAPTMAAPSPAPLAPPAAPERHHAIPAPLTMLIGRSEEVASICAMLHHPGIRLLTLVGPGGIGKTRLAIQLAAEISADYADGVVFVDLTPISDPALVLPAIARALGVGDDGSQDLPAQVHRYCAPRHLCLIIDNAEHVLDAAPAFSAALRAAPRLTIVVTSRVRLDLYGEHVVSVPALALPPRERIMPFEQRCTFDALRLFATRAAAVDQTFQLSPDNISLVDAICRQLDGLPLAIELAAAHVRHLPLVEIAARLGSRLDFLANGPRDAAMRQRTLRALLDWTATLLPPPARRLLGQLAVFHHGWSAQTLAAVCPDHRPDTLHQLGDYHLVTVQREPDGNLRYGMLETVHAYALEQLATQDDAAATRERHADAMLRLLSRCSVAADPARPAGPFPEPEYHNCLAALQWWSTTSDADGMLALAATLWPWWEQRGAWQEGYTWCADVLAATAAHPGWQRVAVLHGASRLASHWGANREASQWIREAAAGLSDYDDTLALQAEVLNQLGVIQASWQEFDVARQSYQQSLGLWKRLDRPIDIARIQHNLGVLAREQGSYAEAEQQLRASLDYFERSDQRAHCALILGNLSATVLAQGRVAEARGQAMAGLVLARQAPTSRAIYNLFYLLKAVMADSDAAATLETLAEIGRLLADRLGLGYLEWLLRLQSQWWAEHGDPTDAVTLLGAWDTIANQLYPDDPGLAPDHQMMHRTTLPRLRTEVGDPAYERAWRMGQSFDPPSALDYARTALVRDGAVRRLPPSP
jgi:predicted ATPase